MPSTIIGDDGSAPLGWDEVDDSPGGWEVLGRATSEVCTLKANWPSESR